MRGEYGYAVLISGGRSTLLLALTDESSKLGLVFFDMREMTFGFQGTSGGAARRSTPVDLAQ